MSSVARRIIRLEARLRPVSAPAPAPEPETDPIDRMVWRILDRARQGRLAATGATGALDRRRACAATGWPPSRERAACHRWGAEVDDEGARLDALGPDAWCAELRELGIDVDGILASEAALLPAGTAVGGPSAQPDPPDEPAIS